MKRNLNHNNTTPIDDDNDKRQKIAGDGLGSYTLVFADGNSIIFDPTTSAKSSLLCNLDSESPVPISQFHEATTARALLTLLASDDNDVSYTSHLTPELYVKILQLCDFLGMAEEISTTLLLHLEPSVPEDPLARLRACHFQLPSFSHILYQRYDTLFATEGDMSSFVSKILSSSPQDMTYYELSLCDGKFSPNKTNLPLHRYAQCERERRLSVHAAAVAKTAALRAALNDDAIVDDGSATDDALRALVWGENTNNSTNTNITWSKKILDQEMWKAIEQGNIEVAKKLLQLGAEPALTKDPKLLPKHYFDYDDEVINYHTSLMLATFRDDLNMMRFLLDNGVEANFCQPVWEEDLGSRGGFNALWVATSTEAMQLLLSRGADPTQECKMVKQGSDNEREICPQPLLLHQIKFDKILIKYGANPNAYHIDYGDYSEGMPPFVSDAYWPKQLARKPLDLKWCEELLTEYGANPNWPVGAKSYTDTKKNRLLKNMIVAFETLHERFKTLPEGKEKESIDQELDAADEAIQKMEEDMEDSEPSIKEPQGLTVLMKAVLTGNIAVVQLLLKHNADPNQFDPTDRTELDSFIYDGDWETNFCVYYSHDGTHRPEAHSFEHDDWKMQSPLSIALEQGNQEMIGLLKSHGATKC
jgi:ankyrin repeat protein